MLEKAKLPPTAWLSTLFIGIYTLFLAIVETRIAVFLFYAKNITTYNNSWSTYGFWIRNHVWLHRRLFSPFGGFYHYAWQFDRSNGISSGSRNFHFILSLPGHFGYFLSPAPKKKTAGRCMDETNYFLYPFTSFLVTVPEYTDNSAADNSSDSGNNGTT